MRLIGPEGMKQLRLASQVGAFLLLGSLLGFGGYHLGAFAEQALGLEFNQYRLPRIGAFLGLFLTWRLGRAPLRSIATMMASQDPNAEQIPYPRDEEGDDDLGES